MNIFRPSTWFSRPRRSQTPPQASQPAYSNAFFHEYLRLVNKEKREARQQTEEFGSVGSYGYPYELVSPYASLYDGRRLLWPLLPAQFGSRLSQSYIYLTQTQLDMLRAYSRWLYETNPYAQGALNTLANYVIGTGFQYQITSKKHQALAKSYIANVNLFLEKFLNKNKWYLKERELYVARKRDGDTFVELFPQDDGITKCRIVQADRIRSNKGEPEYSFGIYHDMEDLEDVYGYEKWSSPEDIEEVPERFMVMFKNHTDSSVLRGLSDFFAVHELLYDAASLNRAARQGEAARQAIAYITQYAYATPQAIATIQANETDFEISRLYTNSNTRIESVRMDQPGEVVSLTKGIEMKDGPAGSDAFEAALHASLRAAAVKWGMPSWMLTGDMNANFASALVAESPFTKRCEWDQTQHKRDYIEVMRRVLQIGIDQGELEQDTLDKVDIVAEGRPVAARNRKDETLIYTSLYSLGVLSARTLDAKHEIDFDAEQELIKEERANGLVNKSMESLSSNNESSTPGAEYSNETSER